MSAEKQQFRLGLVGYGEIGSTLGRGLRGAGLATIACYDKYAFDGPYADLIQSRAKEAGVTLVRSNQELADAADLIFSVTPGSASLESAAAFAPAYRPAHFSRISPRRPPRSRSGSPRGSPAAARSLVTARSKELRRTATPCGCCPAGRPASACANMLSPWGMQIDFMGEKLGTASGIKILRSVLIKGIEALTDEMLLAARHYGLDEIVLASAARRWRGRGWRRSRA